MTYYILLYYIHIYYIYYVIYFYFVYCHARFTPNQLCKDLEKRNIKLGMVIDLTNTYRYYNGKAVSFQLCYFSQFHLIRKSSSTVNSTYFNVLLVFWFCH